MDRERRVSPGNGEVANEVNGNGNGRALTVLLTVMCSLIALTPFAWMVLGTITDLKVQLEACRQSCASEKLEIIVHRAQIDLEDLRGGPGKSLALDELAATLKRVADERSNKKAADHEAGQ